MSENKIKVVIVDDHPIVRKGIESFIEDEDDIVIVGEAANAADAMAVFEKTRPDVAVVDISLDNSSSGLDLLRNMRSRFPQIRALMLSMYDEAIYAERAHGLGARGYLQKNKGPKMIVDAIKEVHAGGTFFTGIPGSDGAVDSEGGLDDQEMLIIKELSNRELEVFQLYGEGFDTNKIAKKLNLSRHTVDSHRKNIKEKLKIRKNNELVMIAAQWIMSKVKKVY